MLPGWAQLPSAAAEESITAEQCMPRCLIASIVLTLLIGSMACRRAARPEASIANPDPLPDAFVQFAKEKRAWIDVTRDELGIRVPGTVWKFFDSACSGDWMASSNFFNQIEHASGRLGNRGSLPMQIWTPIQETFGAYEQFRAWSPQLLQRFADEIIKSIPPGSIYFGGTDPGRFVISSMCSSHTEGRPFFTLTQNALADQNYLEYLHAIYGQKLNIPTPAELGQVFQDYVEDARHRLGQGAMKEEETLAVDNQGRAQVTGIGAVMLLNGRLVELIMKQNPTCECYQEESYPLESLYPRVMPHGLVLKMAREPLDRLPKPVVDRDRDYWAGLTRSLLGRSADEITNVSGLCARTRTLYVRRDTSGFNGMPAYLTDKAAPEHFSRCRSAIASLYQWRSSNTGEDNEKAGLALEADRAHRQAVLLAPFNPEAVWRYTRFLIEQKRTNDAHALLKALFEINMSNWINVATPPMPNALVKLRKTAKELQSEGFGDIPID
jgi:hypothetical protein